LAKIWSLWGGIRLWNIVVFPASPEAGRVCRAAQIGIAARRHLLDGASIPRLCHDDLHAGNVLVRSTREPLLSGIVDFENATAGDAL